MKRLILCYNAKKNNVDCYVLKENHMWDIIFGSEIEIQVHILLYFNLEEFNCFGEILCPDPTIVSVYILHILFSVIATIFTLLIIT